MDQLDRTRLVEKELQRINKVIRNLKQLKKFGQLN